ncbi:PspA/IM30 family protein [Bosea sp. TWI1241]|uniref:PspA/IM30 family protein n=1 Tax=Bosea sp. TWI1241 TaxID=3148904 RepID=UPI00320A5D2D
MLKMFLTLVKGGAAEAGERAADRNAMLILDQQMREAAAGFDRAKTALALAIAQDGRERARLAETAGRIRALEERVAAALAGGEEALAREGAEALAVLEADRDSAAQTQALFAAEIVRLRRHVAGAQVRLAELECGRRIARAAQAVRERRAGRGPDGVPSEATLVDAERTLQRLRERQLAAEAADRALDELDAAAAGSIGERLAARGFGPRLRPSAEEILERLRGRRPAGA